MGCLWHCKICLMYHQFVVFGAYVSSSFVSINPWSLYLKIHGLCTYKSLIFVPKKPWFLYLQIHDSCTYNSSKFVPPFEDPLTYELRLKGLRFVPRFPRILYPGFCKIWTSKSWFFVPTYHRFLYLRIIDLCTPKSVICVPRNHWSLCFQIIDGAPPGARQGNSWQYEVDLCVMDVREIQMHSRQNWMCHFAGQAANH